MKKRMIALLITSMILGIIFTGCSKEQENAETIPNSEVTEVDKTDDAAVKTPDEDNKESEGEKVVSDDITEISKYKVDNIINESDEHGFYSLKYTSKETVDNSFEYFNDVLKGTLGYTTKHLPGILGYVKGTVNDIEIQIGITKDEETEDTLVEVSYRVEE